MEELLKKTDEEIIDFVKSHDFKTDTRENIRSFKSVYNQIRIDLEYDVERMKSNYEFFTSKGVDVSEVQYDKIMEETVSQFERAKHICGLIDSELKKKQAACRHSDADCIYTGHDSHYDYYLCKACGYEYKS